MVSKIKAGYQANVDKFSALLEQSNQLSKTFSYLRLLVFLVTVFLIYFFARHELISALILSVLIGIVVFVFLIRYHSKILLNKKFREAFIKINQNELDALDGNFSCFENGKDYIDKKHPFASDLDIFGEGSLFQFLNRTSTKPGREMLAYQLTNPCIQPEMIKNRQEAITELQDKSDWRQDFQATGVVYEDKLNDKEKIINWLQLPALFSHPFFTVLLGIIPLITLSMIVLNALGIVTENQFMLYLVIPFGIAGMFAIRINGRHLLVSKTSEMLKKYALLLKKIESINVSSAFLLEIKHKLSGDHHSASESVKKLSSILTALDNRLNFVFWIISNGLFLWDILQMRRLENWQKQYRDEVGLWIEAIAEIDALICFSTFSYNHPNNCFPEFVEGEIFLQAEDMGHPLIHDKERVNNPATIDNGQILVITGANMAGKSTYLRTVGVNMVLAMCGSPVCASSFRFKPVNLFTSIHVTDSLHKNESFFYSELKRLQAIITELKNGAELFIILDEILRGTNSKDKHAGSEALLKQLIRFNTSGIIATHDVSLGSLHETFPANIRNCCFEVDTESERLSFDYKLRDGISKNMNATLLMRKMGITV